MNYIVALGNGLFYSENNILDLTVESKITALAAGVLYQQKKGEKIIFSGGHTKGKLKPSEAKKMCDFLLSYFPGIPKNAIILEEDSLDTAGNAENVRNIVGNKYNLVITSFGIHLPRSLRIFKNFGIDVKKLYPSEKVLENISPKFDSIIQQYTLNRKLIKFLKEFIFIFLVCTIDPKGKILRLITSRTRGGE